MCVCTHTYVYAFVSHTHTRTCLCICVTHTRTCLCICVSVCITLRRHPPPSHLSLPPPQWARCPMSSTLTVIRYIYIFSAPYLLDITHRVHFATTYCYKPVLEPSPLPTEGGCSSVNQHITMLHVIQRETMSHIVLTHISHVVLHTCRIILQST